MKNFKLQRGFILGVTAIAILAVAVGAFMRLSSISADSNDKLSQFIKYPSSTNQLSLFTRILNPEYTKTCDKVESTDPATLTDAEKAVVGANGQVYIEHNVPQNKDFRVAVGASEVSKSGAGGIVKFTVYYTPVRIGTSTSTSTVYTEKKGRWMLVFNGDKYLDFYYGNPNLKIGTYQTLTQTVTIPDYTWAQRIDLQLRNGSGFYFQGCVGHILDLVSTLTPIATATASVSSTATATASTTATASSTSTATKTATATTTATSTSTVNTSTMKNGLRGDYYNSNSLDPKSGVLTRIDPNINFDWGTSSPSSGVAKNNFSIRWTGSIMPKYSELYTLRFDHNDGMRVWINDSLVLDRWSALDVMRACTTSAAGCAVTNSITPVVTSTTTSISDKIMRDSIQMNMSANTLYSIKVEYYDGISQAIARMYWQSTSQSLSVVPKENLFTSYDPNPAVGSGNGLEGDYFADTVLSKLFTARTDKTIDFSWGTGAPISGMQKDGFSARWTGSVQPRFSDLYTFLVNAKDGVRLWVDDELIIDQWVKQDKVVQYSGKVQLDAGVKYNIRLEYYNNQGIARVALLWASMSQPKQVIPMKQLYSGPVNASAVASVTPSATPTDTATVTPGPNQVSVKHGFNAIYLPDGAALESTDAFTDLGMTAFAFNRDASKKWNTSIRIMNHDIGYYVYNPLSDQTVNVSYIKKPEHARDQFIVKGWNLLANSGTSDMSVANTGYFVSSDCEIKGGEPICNTIGTKEKLGDLLTTKRAYGYIYIIKDPYAADADSAFELVKVTASNVGSIKIPAGKLFWFYLYN